MAHETHNETNPAREKTKVSFQSSFWLIIILVGLFIAALNFIPAMSEKEGNGEKKETTEEVKGATPAAETEKKEATEAPKKAEETKPAAEAEHK